MLSIEADRSFSFGFENIVSSGICLSSSDETEDNSRTASSECPPASKKFEFISIEDEDKCQDQDNYKDNDEGKRKRKR